MTKMNEANIIYEKGSFWVYKHKDNYTVYRIRLTHSVSDSSYPLTEDGLSLAKARVDYLSKVNTKTPESLKTWRL